MRKQKVITGSIQPKDGKLYAVINLYVDGKRKPKWIDTGFKERDGKKRANKFLNDELFKLNNQGPLLKDISLDMPYVDCLRLWLKTKTKIEDNTYAGYEDIIEGRVNKFFSERGSTLSNLEPEDFEDYYDSMYADGLTECTALHHHRVMSQALKYAVKKGPLYYNVMDKVDAPSDSTFVGDYYRVEEVLDLFENEFVRSDPLYITSLLATYYGFRRSEVLGLRWSSIDLIRNTISVERKIVSVKRKGKKAETKDTDKLKTKYSRRTLPLIPIVAFALKQEKALQEEMQKAFGNEHSGNPNGYVCVDCYGNLHKPDYVTNHFKWLLRKTKNREIRFHDLRHTCASLLVMNGVPLANVAAWLGHSTVKTTERFYSHRDHISQQTSADKICELLPIKIEAETSYQGEVVEFDSCIWLDLGNLQVVQGLLTQYKISSVNQLQSILAGSYALAT